MYLLRNNDKFNDIVSYDAKSGNWERLDSGVSQNVAHADVSGFFAILSSRFCAMFRSGSQIIACVGDVQLPLSPRVRINVSGKPAKRQLTISQDGNVIVNHEYSLDGLNQFEDDLTPMIEDEDFDFGLFMANIAGSQERQEVLLNNS